MVNPKKGEAEIELGDGRKITLCYNANAWIEAEEVLGKPTPDIIDELQGGRASMKTQRALMWAGLRKHHSEITLDDAGEMLIDAAEAMSRALNGGLPEPEPEQPLDEEEAGEEAEPGPRKRRGAGTKS
jgi:hypothetical protein